MGWRGRKRSGQRHKPKRLVIEGLEPRSLLSVQALPVPDQKQETVSGTVNVFLFIIGS
jgi:hypothetical protein